MTGWFFQSLNVWNEGGTNELGPHFGTVPIAVDFLFASRISLPEWSWPSAVREWICDCHGAADLRPRKRDAMDENTHENPHWHLEKGHYWCSEEFWPYVVLFERRDHGSKQSNPIPWMSNTPRKHSLVGFLIHIWDYIVIEVLKILGEWDHLMILNGTKRASTTTFSRFHNQNVTIPQPKCHDSTTKISSFHNQTPTIPQPKPQDSTTKLSRFHN